MDKQKTPDTDGTVVFRSDAIYTLEAAKKALGVTGSRLLNEIRKGRLRVAKRCGMILTTGRWLQEWFEDGEKGPRYEDKQRFGLSLPAGQFERGLLIDALDRVLDEGRPVKKLQEIQRIALTQLREVLTRDSVDDDR